MQQLSAIDELAIMDVLCCDKTGTLTLNRVRLTRLTRPGAADARLTRLTRPSAAVARLTRLTRPGAAKARLTRLTRPGAAETRLTRLTGEADAADGRGRRCG